MLVTKFFREVRGYKKKANVDKLWHHYFINYFVLISKWDLPNILWWTQLKTNIPGRTPLAVWWSFLQAISLSANSFFSSPFPSSIDLALVIRPLYLVGLSVWFRMESSCWYCFSDWVQWILSISYNIRFLIMGLVGKHSRFLTTEVSGASKSGFFWISHFMASMMKLINCLSGSDTSFWPFRRTSSLIRATISEQPAK